MAVNRPSPAIRKYANRCRCSQHQARQRCDLGKSALVIHPDGGSPWHWSLPTVDHCAQAPSTAQVLRSLGPERSLTRLMFTAVTAVGGRPDRGRSIYIYIYNM